MNQIPFSPGLDGIYAGETAISTLDGGLQYRGYAVRDLAADATFEEVAYLLLRGQLPNEEELADFEAVLSESSDVPAEVLEFLSQIPLHIGEMDVLRTAISALSHWDMQADDPSPNSNLAKAERLLGQIPILIAARYRQRQGLSLLEPLPGVSIAGNLLYLIHGDEAEEERIRCLDAALILYAEHEFNASTFAARVVASTQADLHSAIVAAIAALKGPLHGGVNEQALTVLQELGSPDRAEAWVKQALAHRKTIWGFGHRVYKEGDPRAYLLKEYCQRLARTKAHRRMEETADVIERACRDQKGLYPNLDWPSARLYHYLGLDPDLFTPLFVASRCAGWAAHVIEQSQQKKMIHPRARYCGPTGLSFEPLCDRGD